MTTASVTVLKAKLSEYLAKVKRGVEVSVTEHGRPVARIVPAARTVADEDAEIAELVRLGIARAGRKGGVRPSLLRLSPVKDPDGSVLKALLEEREENYRKGYR